MIFIRFAFIFIFLSIMILQSVLFANNTQVSEHKGELNYLSLSFSEFLWNYDINLIEKNLKSSVENYGLKRAVLYDNGLKEYHVVFKEKNQLLYKKSDVLFDNFKDEGLVKITKIIKRENLNLGSLTLYFKDTNNIDINTLLTFEEKQWLKNKKILNVSADENYPPYDFVKNGESTGYSTEYVKLLGEKLGIHLNFVVDKSWKNTLQKFCDRKIDILHATDMSYMAKKCGKFSKPQIRDNRLIVTRKNGFTNIKSSDDLIGYTMVTPKGWSNESIYRKKYGDKIKYIQSKDIEEALELIRQGKADFTTGSSNVLQYFVLKNGYENLIFHVSDIKQTEDTIQNDNLYIATRDDEPLLLSIINKAMNSIAIDEKIKLREKWFGENNKVNDKLTPKQIEYLKEKKEIRYCIDPLWKPIEFINKNGVHDGVGALFIKDIEKFLDIKLTLVATNSWSETLQKAREGQCDMVPLIQNTPSRSNYLNFTKPYLIKDNTIATKKGIEFIENLNTLKTKKVGVVKEYFIEEKLKQTYKNLEIIGYDSIFDGLKAVEKGEIFGFVDITPVLAYTIIDKGLNLKISGETKIPINLSFGVNKNNKELLEIIEVALENISGAKKIEYSNLYTNLVREKIDYTLVLQIIFIAIVIISLFIYWNKKLSSAKKEIEKKNEELDKLLLIQSRQATFGTMIDTISHQWKQPLNELGLQMMYLDTQMKFENKVPSKVMLKQTVEKSNNILEFMSKTIDIFRNFYKTSKDTTDVNISEVINDIILFLDSTFETDNINIITDIEPNITIKAIEEEFAHAILNIFVNAKDVFKARGIKKPLIDVNMKMRKEKIIITIKDNAGGISIEPIESIFKSNISEKEHGGVGLYITTKIIEERLNGTIEVSNCNLGAKFVITLNKYHQPIKLSKRGYIALC